MTLGRRTRSGARPVRFLMVGIGAAALLFTLSFLLARAGLAPFAASTLAYLIAFAVAYAAQRSWTFDGEQDHRVALPRYLALQSGCALFAGMISHVSVASFGASPFAMSLVATVLTSAVSYFLSSRWVFVRTTA